MRNCRGTHDELGDAGGGGPGSGELVAHLSIGKYGEPLLGVLDRTVAPGGTVVLSDIYRKQTDTFLAMARQRGWQVETLDRAVHLATASHDIRIAVLNR